jgi:hypothetical protein
MGQARLRQTEIAELKRWGGRLIETPKKSQPVLVRAGDRMWMTTDTEFGQWVTAAHAIDQPPKAQQEFARLALIAERSGVRESECQQWFELQLQQYATHKLTKPWPKPHVFAQSHK